MHGSRAIASELAQEVIAARLPEAIDIVVCPPFPYLLDVADQLASSHVAIGAQNTHWAESGAYTGEVSVSMLRDCRCDYVIVGHSERRAMMSESSADVGLKARAVLAGRMKPIICVGETAQERAANETLRVVVEMVDAVTAVTGADAWREMILAYEPVWAIGTGETASPEQAQEVHKALRDRLTTVCGPCAQQTRILYGGSVKAGNASELFAQPDIDGGLIGGASLDANEFAAICNAAVKI